MLVQNISFIPNVAVSPLKSKYQSNPTPTTSSPIAVEQPKIDYSKIAFGAIYNVKPKKINLEAEKAKLLKQITEILQTDVKDADPNDAFIGAIRRALAAFRSNLEREVQIFERMKEIRDDKRMNPQQKYEEAKKLERQFNKIRKNLCTSNQTQQKTPKLADERLDYKLLNELRTALLEDNFDLQKVFEKHYSRLKDIKTIDELKEIFPKIKTPKSPVEVIAKKIEASLGKDFYEGIGAHLDSAETIVDYTFPFLQKPFTDIAVKYNVNIEEFFHKVFERTMEQVIYKAFDYRDTGFSAVAGRKKVTTPQVSPIDMKLLYSDFDDFVLSTIGKHYLGGEKYSDIVYEKDGQKIATSELKNSDYKFEKLSEKIRGFIKTGKSLDSAQKDYDNFSPEELRHRLGQFANGDAGSNELILSNIIDFDGCSFTPEDKVALVKFLRELDNIKDGKKTVSELADLVQDNQFRPTGTQKLNEIERQKVEAQMKVLQRQTAELNGLKSEFDKAINVLYSNDLNELAGSCTKLRPTSLEDAERSKFFIDTVNKNMKNPNNPMSLNRQRVEQNITRWETYNYYLRNAEKADLLKKAQTFAQSLDGTVDIDKAGHYLINSEIVSMYPKSAELSKYPEVLEKIMQRAVSDEDATICLSKFEDYIDMNAGDKLQIAKLMDMFDLKNPAQKGILKHIVENEYILEDTHFPIKTARNDAIMGAIGVSAKKAILDKYKFPQCLSYLRGFEEGLSSFAKEWGSSGIKKIGKNNNAIKYKMELKLVGEDDRLFSSNNDFVFDVYSAKGLH